MIGIGSTGKIIDNENVTVAGTLYHYDGSTYGTAIPLTNLEDYKGYWIKCNDVGTITLEKDHTQLNEATNQVVKGWNMIGVSANSQIIDNDNIIVPGTLYHYDGSTYGTAINVNDVQSNKGYWIKCNDVGTITIQKL
jgi:uncharacterized protein YifN (PemK superfamily)